MMANVVLFVIGLVSFVIGVLLVRYRKGVAKANAEANRSFFGELGELGERVANNSTPFYAAMVGMVASLIGLFVMIAAFFYRQH
jgi:hypothetical protein